MSDQDARRLALQINEVYQDRDPYEYANILADFDNNEELLLEDIFNTLKTSPEVIIKGLLTAIED